MVNAREAFCNAKAMKRFNRPQAEISNRAAAKIANEVNRIEHRLHDDLVSIDDAVANTESKIVTTGTLISSHKRGGDIGAYITEKNALDQLKSQIKRLKEEKANLINEALPPDKYRETITSLVSHFDSDSRKRRAKIKEYLAEAINLLYAEYDDQLAYQSVINQLQYTLCTEQNKSALDVLRLTHYSPLGINVSLDNDAIYNGAETLSELTKSL